MINKKQRLSRVRWEFTIYVTGCAGGMAIYKMFILNGLLGAVITSVLFLTIFISASLYWSRGDRQANETEVMSND